MEQQLDTLQINFSPENLWILNIALAFVMYGIALEISLSDFKRLWFAPRPIFTGLLSQFLLLPALTFILVLLLKPEPGIALGMFLVAACPGGNVSNFMTYLAGGNNALSVSLTALATLMAVMMTPFNLQFWGSLYGPTEEILEQVAVAPAEMVKLVLLLLAIPLVLGMLTRHYYPRLANVLAKKLKWTSLVFFLLLILLALYDNSELLVSRLQSVFWMVLLHNALALSAGYTIATLMKLDGQDRRTLAIETGIQNSGLGLLLIFTFFEQLGTMALLTAVWGIWHLVSGLAISGYWSSRPLTKNIPG